MLRFVVLHFVLAHALPETCADATPHTREAASEGLSNDEFKAWRILGQCLPDFFPYIYPSEVLQNASLFDQKTGLPLFYVGATSRPSICNNVPPPEIPVILNVSGIMNMSLPQRILFLTQPSVEEKGQFFLNGDVLPSESLADNPGLGDLWFDTHIPYCFEHINSPARYLVTLSMNAIGAQNGNLIQFVLFQSCNAPGLKVRFTRTTDVFYPQSVIGKAVGEQANRINAPLGPSATQDITVTLIPPFVFSVVYMHELMHTLGFGHTMQRTDSDLCLNLAVYDENLGQPRQIDCEIAVNPPTIDYGTYDFGSIMHYPNIPLINPCGTIQENPIPNPLRCVGNFGNLALNIWQLSPQDIFGMNAMYAAVGHNPGNYNP